jgi:hypothetical protein
MHQSLICNCAVKLESLTNGILQVDESKRDISSVDACNSDCNDNVVVMVDVDRANPAKHPEKFSALS